MDRKHWKRWEKLRKNGKAGFVLVYGGLYAGLIAAALITLFFQLVNPENYWIARLVVFYLIFAFLGMLITLYIWDSREKKFLSANPPKPRRVHYPYHPT